MVTEIPIETINRGRKMRYFKISSLGLNLNFLSSFFKRPFWLFSDIGFYYFTAFTTNKSTVVNTERTDVTIDRLRVKDWLVDEILSFVISTYTTSFCCNT